MSKPIDYVMSKTEYNNYYSVFIDGILICDRFSIVQAKGLNNLLANWFDPDTPPYAKEDVEALIEHCWEHYTQHEYRCPEGQMCSCPYPELHAILARLKGETKGTE